jgi:hypothetical protein
MGAVYAARRRPQSAIACPSPALISGDTGRAHAFKNRIADDLIDVF